MMTTYTVFSPDYVNFPLGVINHNGNILSGVRALDVIIANAKKGSVSYKANNLLCVPDIERPKEKDLISLGALLGSPNEPKDRNFVSNLLKRFLIDEVKEVEKKDLLKRSIKSGNRYMSKIDWTSDRVKNQVQGLLAQGKSLSYIARHLGVSRSALTKANERHNYRLYIPDLSKAK